MCDVTMFLISLWTTDVEGEFFLSCSAIRPVVLPLRADEKRRELANRTHRGAVVQEDKIQGRCQSELHV